MDEPLLTVTVYGTPAGQGAISHGAHGRGYHSNGRRLIPWRTAIRNAALAAAGTHVHRPPLGLRPKSGPCLLCKIPKAQHGALAGPLRVEIDITVPRLASDPARAWPITRSSYDWDHHARAVCDALGEASVWRDDAQVVDGRVRKSYVGRPGALDRPGAAIRIWEAL